MVLEKIYRGWTGNGQHMLEELDHILIFELKIRPKKEVTMRKLEDF